ncbi:MAG TPA: glycosyltransferase family 4 protein [Rhodanobacteraceae bacterium]|nr:glycosyltransferase family 4 protein [Rhodanobacteraceae bacterium]
MNIGILVPVLSDKDAVGADALEMAAALEKLGHTVRVFAQTTIGHVGVTAKPAALADFVAKPDDLVIYHFSFGWPPGLPLLRGLACRRIVRYHNITPASFFEGYSQEYVGACASGRAEIEPLAALGCELYLGDSPFNVEDFLAAGVDASRTAVLPPFHRIDRLLHTHADLALLDRYRDGSGTWLSVGRIAPNKGHLDLVDAFAVYRRAYDADARLLIVGRADPRLARYTGAVRARIDDLGLTEAVHFLSDVNDGQLKAAYLVADALVSLSAHEGFCVPLTEAMALGTPIVAYGAGAVASTTADAGLVWDSPDPYPYAASVARLRSDAGLRRALRERGLARMHDVFATDALVAGLAGVMERFA